MSNSSSDYYGWQYGRIDRCRKCGDCYCIEADCEKYLDPDYYENLGKDLLNAFDIKEESTEEMTKESNNIIKKKKTKPLLGPLKNENKDKEYKFIPKNRKKFIPFLQYGTTF